MSTQVVKQEEQVPTAPLDALVSVANAEEPSGTSPAGSASDEGLTPPIRKRKFDYSEVELEEGECKVDVLVVSALGHTSSEYFAHMRRGGVNSWADQVSSIISCKGRARTVDRLSQYALEGKKGVRYTVFTCNTQCREGERPPMPNFWISALLNQQVFGTAVILRKDRTSMTKRELFELYRSRIPCNEYENEFQ